jgi:hypothetical protein
MSTLFRNVGKHLPDYAASHPIVGTHYLHLQGRKVRRTASMFKVEEYIPPKRRQTSTRLCRITSHCRNALFLSSGQQSGTYWFHVHDRRAHSSETSVNIYQTTQRHIPGYSNLHRHHRDDLRSHKANEICGVVKKSFWEMSAPLYFTASWVAMFKLSLNVKLLSREERKKKRANTKNMHFQPEEGTSQFVLGRPWCCFPDIRQDVECYVEQITPCAAHWAPTVAP